MKGLMGKVLTPLYCMGGLLYAHLCGAQPLAEREGLKRFDAQSQFSQHSQFDVKSQRIGDNIVQATQHLVDQGGELHYITGGTRSRRIKVSFYSVYQDTRLQQLYTLNFHKDNGFIQSIEVNYALESAYRSIGQVRDTVFRQALKKYGPALSMQTIQSATGKQSGQVKLTEWAAALQQDNSVHPGLISHLSNLTITPKSGFSADQDGYAVLRSGFERCYFWRNERPSELLSLCSFDEQSGNQKGRGVSLILRAFELEQSIEDYRHNDDPELTIELD